MPLTLTPRTRLGSWQPGNVPPATDPDAMRNALYHLAQTLVLTESQGKPALGEGGQIAFGGGEGLPIFSIAPTLRPEDLGDPEFVRDHRLKYPYLAGAMASGIGSAEIVIAMSRAGMLGFFRAGGLPLPQVEAAIERVQRELGDAPYGFNLLHSQQEPDLEAAVVELYLKRGVHLVEAAAYMSMTLPLIRYRVTGIHRAADGTIVTPNRVIAKVSRVEVASRFFAPPPANLLAKLVEAGQLTAEEAELAKHVPVAQDLTAEADSGGHTDNRPAIAMLPTMMALRDRMQAEYGYQQRLRVGAAGGISTPASAAAAFAMGAAYVLTGSVNQSCVESGTSDLVRQMLAGAQQADVAMAPAGDMFELGVKVQVLKRGTMFAMRAQKLYDLYKAYDGLETIPDDVRVGLEKDLFRAPLEEIWAGTRTFFLTRDPSQVERAERDPKHRMALVFRWYLGLSSRWSKSGDASRKADYQIWCGPAMGAFNEWVKGSCLEAPENRHVVTVALNILVGACALTRWNILRMPGHAIAPELAQARVLPLDQLQALLA